MKKSSANRLKRALASFGAGGSVLCPAFAYFTAYAPPLLPQIGLILSPVAAAVLWAAYSYSPTRRKQIHGLSVRIFRGVHFLVLSVLLLASYMALLKYCTALDPQKGRVRFQIGFGRQDWSLTDVGRHRKATSPSMTIEDWMLAERAFAEGGPSKLWKDWTIYGAGSLLMVVFLCAFLFWNVAYGLLARERLKPD